MFTMQIAGICIAVENQTAGVERYCRAYLCDDRPVQMQVKVTDDKLAAERARTVHAASDAYLESLCIYREIALKMLAFDGFLLHAAVIEADGNAYAFLAKSGTGKSTHIRLWKELLGDRVTVVNGDKPLIRFMDGQAYACGTPWCGKEGWNRNAMVPLRALVFVDRAANHGGRIQMQPLSAKEAASRLLRQILLPGTPEAAEKQLELADRLLGETPAWLLYCDISIGSAQLAYDTLMENAGRWHEPAHRGSKAERNGNIL